MTISQAAALLGLDEVAAVRPVPLTDAEIDATQPVAAPSPSPGQPRRREVRTAVRR